MDNDQEQPTVDLDTSDQDDLEQQSIVSESVAYVRIQGTHLEKVSQAKFAQHLATENEPATVPLFAYRVRSFMKLVYRTPDQRDNACKNNLYVEGLAINPEKPFAETGLGPQRTKTLYLHGLPINVNHAAVGKWLTDTLGLQLVEGTALRWVTYQGTEIRSGARSCIVQVPHGTEVPGFAVFRSPGIRGSLKIHIWYKGTPLWCRRCCGKGHSSNNCLMGKWATPLPKDLVPQIGPVISPLATEHFPQLSPTSPTPRTVPDSNAENQQPDPKPTSGRPESELDQLYGDNIVGFFTKASTFSNHYPCNMWIANEPYNSTEQYLFINKAREAKDNTALNKIYHAGTNVGKIKTIGDRIPWPKGREDWQQRAQNLLWEANLEKYKQNPVLRHKLFETSGSRLAECSSNRFWGVGLPLDNPAYKTRSNWTGLNKFGDMLTKLRDQLLQDPKFTSEPAAIEAGRKRALSASSDSASPSHKHPTS